MTSRVMPIQMPQARRYSVECLCSPQQIGTPHARRRALAGCQQEELIPGPVCIGMWRQRRYRGGRMAPIRLPLSSKPRLLKKTFSLSAQKLSYQFELYDPFSPSLSPFHQLYGCASIKWKIPKKVRHAAIALRSANRAISKGSLFQ